MESNIGVSLEDLIRQKAGPLTIDFGSGFQTTNNDSSDTKHNQSDDVFEKNVDNSTESKEEISNRLFKQGVKSLKANNPFAALPDLYAAWALDPGCLKAVNNIVIAFWQLKCPEMAMKTVELVLSIEPDNKTALSHQKFLKSKMKN